MYERLLDKSIEPTVEAFYQYCGVREAYLKQIDRFLMSKNNITKQLAFPYGNSYGWCFKYYQKKSNICNVFAEKDAFSVMLRLTNAQVSLLTDVSDYTRNYLENMYPCSNGGWIHYRVLEESHMLDLIKILSLKVK